MINVTSHNYQRKVELIMASKSKDAAVVSVDLADLIVPTHEGDKPEGDKPEGDKPEGDKPKTLTLDQAKLIVAAAEKRQSEYNASLASLPQVLSLIASGDALAKMLADAKNALGTLDLDKEYPDLAEARRVVAWADPVKAFDLMLDEFRGSDLHKLLVGIVRETFDAWQAKIDKLNLPQGAITSKSILDDGFHAKLTFPGSRTRGAGESNYKRQVSPALIVPGSHISTKTPSSYRVVVRATWSQWWIELYADNDNKLDSIDKLAGKLPIATSPMREQDGKVSLSGEVNNTIRSATKNSTNSSMAQAIFVGNHDSLYVANMPNSSELHEAITQARLGNVGKIANLPEATALYSNIVPNAMLQYRK